MAREAKLRRVDAVGSGAPVGGPGAPLDRGTRRGGARAHPRAGADRGNLNQIARWTNTYKAEAEAVEIVAHLVTIERALAALAPVVRPDSDAH